MKGGVILLIEDLIRLGSLYLKSKIPSSAVIRQITDVMSPMTKNFWKNVWVVEVLDDKIKTRCKSWGSQKNGEFSPDYEKVVAAPINIPAGGNKILAQGFYPMMTYPLFDKHFTSFIEGPFEVEKFLKDRLIRTETGINSKLVQQISQIIPREFAKEYKGDKDNKLGVLIIAAIQDDGLYYYTDKVIGNVDEVNKIVLGKSSINPGKYIILDLNKASELIWQAKEKEGMEKGFAEDGKCDITGEQGKVLSSYNKAWPWYTITWDAPFSIYQDRSNLVESIALSPKAYRCLTYGATLVKKLTKRVPYWLAREIFSPVESVEAKNYTRSTTDIYGFCYVLPITESFLEDEQERDNFIRGIENIIIDEVQDTKGTTRLHLENILALPYMLSEDLQKDQYRVTVVYYTGNINRGDIHLNALIEDVIPSTIDIIDKIFEELLEYIYYLSQKLDINSDKTNHCFDSLPYLLTKAYGGPYLWPTLSKVLHKQTLNNEKFIKNAATRMNELSKGLSKNYFKLKSEALFYFTFKQFLYLYNLRILKEGGDKVENWTQIYDKFIDPASEIEIKSVAEAGFIAGLVTKKFSQQYYANQMWKAGISVDIESKGKRNPRQSFISQRVMTYGSTLTPEVIFKNALSKFKEYEYKLGINLAENIERKNGVLLLYYLDNKEKIHKNKDDFMAAFWAGFSMNVDSKKSEEGNKNNDK
jgi:hypothetical protein